MCFVKFPAIISPDNLWPSFSPLLLGLPLYMCWCTWSFPTDLWGSVHFYSFIFISVVQAGESQLRFFHPIIVFFSSRISTGLLFIQSTLLPYSLFGETAFSYFVSSLDMGFLNSLNIFKIVDWFQRLTSSRTHSSRAFSLCMGHSFFFLCVSYIFVVVENWTFKIIEYHNSEYQIQPVLWVCCFYS